MENTVKENVWIYNSSQADFYFSRGIAPITTGIGSWGDKYVKFKNTDEVISAFTEWCIRSKQLNNK